MRPLRLLGTCLAAALIVWIVGSIAQYDHWRPAPEILGLGNAFEGSAQLPKEEITKNIDHARARMIEINQRGRWFSLSGDICAWFAFACTAGVTLIAGWFGRGPGTGNAAPNTAGLPVGATRTIGLLAGLAAVLTAGGTMATNRGHDQYDKAKQVQTLTNQATKAVLEAKTGQDAQTVLDDLRLKTDQL
jgi:hypothetical protein